ncbi:MAG: hypothetical protein J6N21_13635 [Butyrivibrio sp.]|nr:hypothetical protein [Butyrivibrio sp.]
MIAGIAEWGDIPLLVSGICFLDMTTIEITAQYRLAACGAYPTFVAGYYLSCKMFPKLEP